MCLNLPIGYKEQIATEDIVCYKVVEKTGTKGLYATFWQEASVKLGGEYESEIVINPSIVWYGKDIITVALHSFVNISIAIQEVNFYRNTVAIKCIIPKGAKYYISNNGFEYASNKIKYIEELKTN